MKAGNGCVVADRVMRALRRLGAVLLPLAASLLLSSCEAVGQQQEEPGEEGAQRPAHHTADGYRNLHVAEPDRRFFDFLAMRWFGDTKWADHAARAAEVPVRDLDVERVRQPPPGIRISWLGHSTFLLQGKSVNILTDPAFGNRVSPLSFAGPKRYTRHVVDYANLPPIDVVVISHNHYDHLDLVAIKHLGDGPRYLVPLGLKPWFVRHGITPGRILELDWWDSTTAAGLTFQAMPSQHWSARGLTDRFATLWASWLIHLDGRAIWFAGDTGYNPVQFREIGQTANRIDIALIPIGGYAPRWFMGPYHVNPEEAIRIHADVRARQSIGMHWGTYPLTAEGPIDPVVELEKRKKEYGLQADEFVTMALGESIDR